MARSEGHAGSGTQHAAGGDRVSDGEIDRKESTPTQLKTRSDWNGDPPPREWVYEGWLGYRLTLFTGHGGKGKSRLALQLAAAVASGTSEPWIPPARRDRATRTAKATLVDDGGAPVLVASWEDEADEVHRRLHAMAATLPWAAVDHIEDRLHFTDLAGGGALWDGGLRIGKELTNTGRALRAAAEHIKARLLIIDPRAAAYAGDENHRARVRAFISHWDRWARENRCAVLLIDHLPKYATQQQDVRSAAYAGSTDWHNASRSVWTLDDQNGNLVLRCDKTNYGSVPDPVTLESTDGCVWQAKSGTVRRRAVKKNPHG